MHIDAVIGANYGDEGKGLVTEFRCRNNSNPIVILSNGGCQRGHTVNNVEKGIRHVFHHFGSGTLLGVPSLYAKTFLLNPIKYVEERKELVDAGIDPIAYRAPGCILQLPVDMFVNQQLEKHRSKSNSKHGSCGWGIWETQVRNKNRDNPLTFCEFESFSFEKKMQVFREETEAHVFDRLLNENIGPDVEILEILMSDAFIKHFIADFETMAKQVKCLENDNLLDNGYGYDVKSFVVENAQGLLLDKRYAPKDKNGSTDIHTTPSKCGLEGVLDALGDDVDLDDVSTFYVSRTYLTRHGDGPFPEEDADMKLDASEDATNMPNEYQGCIRCGKFTVESQNALMQRIDADGHETDKNIVFTHCKSIDNITEWNVIHNDNIYLSYDEDSRKISKASNR